MSSCPPACSSAVKSALRSHETKVCSAQRGGAPPLILQDSPRSLSQARGRIAALLADITACLPRIIYKTHALNSCTPEGYSRHSFRQINIFLFSIVLLNADCCLVGENIYIYINDSPPIMLRGALFWSLKIFIRGGTFHSTRLTNGCVKGECITGAGF